jgi:hypothetical protein
VAVVGSHEVLDSTGRSILKLVATDEVVCQLVLCCIGARAVHDGHGAISLDAIPIGIDFSHRAGNCCSLQTSGSSIVASRVLEGSAGERTMCFVKQFGR